MPPALPLSLQARLLDALATQAEPTASEADLLQDPQALRQALVEVAQDQALAVTPAQVDRAVRQLIAPTPAAPLPLPDPFRASQPDLQRRPDSLAERDAWLTHLKARRARVEKVRNRYLDRAHRWFLGHAGSGLLVGVGLAIGLGKAIGVHDLFMWIALGLACTCVSIGLGVYVLECLPLRRVQRDERKLSLWRRYHRRLTHRIEGLAGATPLVKDLDRWAKIPPVADLARARMTSPVGLLCQDVEAIEDAYKAALPAYRQDQDTQKIQAFMEGTA